MLTMPNEQIARMTAKRYVCSNCWSELVLHYDHKIGWSLECSICGDELNGFVSKYFAERRRTESLGEARDVKRMLQNVGVIEKKKEKPASELLKELGF